MPPTFYLPPFLVNTPQYPFARTYLKNHLSAHGCVAKRFKMYCSSRFQRDSVTVPRLVLNPNLFFEIGSKKTVLLDQFKQRGAL